MARLHRGETDKRIVQSLLLQIVLMYKRDYETAVTTALTESRKQRIAEPRIAAVLYVKCCQIKLWLKAELKSR